MCLGSPSAPAYAPPKPPVYEKGPASPDDMVNNQVVENINDRSQQDAMRSRNKGPTASTQKTPGTAPSQSSKTDRAY